MTATAREIESFRRIKAGRMAAVEAGTIPAHVGAAQACEGTPVRVIVAFFAEHGVRWERAPRRAEVVAEVAETFFGQEA